MHVHCLSTSSSKNLWAWKRCQFTTKVSKIIQNYFIFFYFSVSPHQPYPCPLPIPPLLTVLGWRLKSLEWALSNFYPSSFTASHDPWDNGITPWLLFFSLFLCISLPWILNYYNNFRFYNLCIFKISSSVLFLLLLCCYLNAPLFCFPLTSSF